MPNEHIVKSYDEELQRLTQEITRMGRMAVAQLESALDVIERFDPLAAERIIANDVEIDALEQSIAHDVMRLALRSPWICGGVGWLAGGICASTRERLATLAASQVLRAIDAYEKRDVQAAMAMREDDARLDALYTALFRELLTYMMEDPRNITACTHLLFMAKNLERVGDHATNIAENLWFLVHGDTPLPAREKADRTSGN